MQGVLTLRGMYLRCFNPVEVPLTQLNLTLTWGLIKRLILEIIRQKKEKNNNNRSSQRKRGKTGTAQSIFLVLFY